jgi:hypothetical protein
MARFEREAKVLASLNHPNIAPIYGVEDHALIMGPINRPEMIRTVLDGSGTEVAALEVRSTLWRRSPLSSVVLLVNVRNVAVGDETATT